MNLETLTTIKLRCKYRNGVDKHGKDVFRSVSFARVSKTITPEQAYQVATYVGAILNKEAVCAIKITEDEYTKA